MGRSLAHIERITAIEPIVGADRIEVATVLGWKVVVRKNEFKVGDLACYVEIDSVLPKIPYFEFMKDRKYRVRTIKLKQQVSQGLLIKCDQWETNKAILPYEIYSCEDYFYEGNDVTKQMGIVKYESPSDRESNFVGTSKKKHNWFVRYMTRYSWFRKLFHIKSKSFPSWISKTDEDRIQNIPRIFKDTTSDWYITEKIDGQSATYWYKHKLFPEFGICSRTVRKSELDGSNWAKVARQFDIKNKLKNLHKDYAIQGEIISGKIQGGKYHNNQNKNIESPYDFYVFNVYDIKANKYLDYYEIRFFCDNVELKMVPVLSCGAKLLDSMEEMISFADGKSLLADTDREGVVWRKINQSQSFKVISNKYLLKEKNE